MDQQAADRPTQFNPIIQNEMMIVGWRLMELPTILMTAWWHQAMQAWQPLALHHQHPKIHEKHDQLVVPEPIEEEGEHALFA